MVFYDSSRRFFCTIAPLFLWFVPLQLFVLSFIDFKWLVVMPRRVFNYSNPSRGIQHADIYEQIDRKFYSVYGYRKLPMICLHVNPRHSLVFNIFTNGFLH